MSLDLIAASATFPGLATTGAQTIAGDKSFTGTSTLFTSQIFMADTAASKAIRFQANTTDGTDDYRLLISSGGGAGPNRGAYVEMHGNEFSSTPGRILWESGSAASGTAIAWQVHVGASSVLGHSINGNGLSVIGPTGSLGTGTGHQIYGPVLSQISSAIAQMSISAADRGYIGCNIYLDSAGGAKRSIVNAVGYSFLQLDRSPNAGDACFRVVANNDTQTNGVAGASVVTNERTVFQATFAGACTFATPAFTGEHIAYGNIRMGQNVSSNTIPGSPGYLFGCGGAAGAGFLLVGTEPIDSTPAWAGIRLRSDGSGHGGLIEFQPGANAASSSYNGVSHMTLDSNGNLVVTAKYSSTGNTGLTKLDLSTNSVDPANPTVKIKNENTANSTNVIAMEVSLGANGGAAGARFINFLDVDSEVGRIQLDSGTTSSFVGSSDARLKTDPKPIANALDTVNKLFPYDFKWVSQGTRGHGFYAQQVHEVYPQVVAEGGKDVKANPWGIDYGKLTPLLTAAIQELSAKNDALEARIVELES